MSDHAVLSPSGAERWMKCPGSVALTRGMPDTDSVWSREGTFAHDYAALLLDSEDNADRVLGATGATGSEEFSVDEEMAEALQTYLDVVRELHAEKGAGLLIEQTVRLEGLTDEVWGTADAIVICHKSKTLHVVDFKYGAGVLVDVEDNPQLKIYALGALLTFPNLCEGVEKVVAHVVQPRHFMGGHFQQSYTAKELRAWGETELLDAIKATDEPDAPLNPGEWCQWCKTKATCPALQAKSLEAAREVFADTAELTPVPQIPDPKELSVDRIGQMLAVFPMVEKWMAAVRENAYERAAQGDEIPDHKLVRKVTHRKWKDPDRAAELLALIADKPLFSKPKLKTPNQVEKLFGKSAVALVARLTVKPEGGTVLAHKSDPRAEVTPAKAEDVFDNLDEADKPTKSND